MPGRSRRNDELLEAPTGWAVIKGFFSYLRSDDGTEFSAKKLRQWLSKAGVITAYIVPGCLCENGYCKSYKARRSDEFLNLEMFGNL